MKRFTGIGSRLFEKIKNQVDNPERFNRKKWTAYGVLLLVSFILFLSLGGSKHRTPVTPPGDMGALTGDTFEQMSNRSVGMGEPDQPEIEWEKIPEGIDPVYRTWGRDPFASGNHVAKEETRSKKSKLVLTAISWRDGEAIVLINDSILKRGDFVDGAEILEIYEDSVTLMRDNKRIVLDLSEGG